MRVRLEIRSLGRASRQPSVQIRLTVVSLLDAPDHKCSPLHARWKALSRFARIWNCFSQGRKKMAAERSYDAIVIGAGQGGKPLSMVLARAGLKTAVIEVRYVGGTCVNYG